MLGAVLTLSFISALQLPLILAVPLAIAATTLIGVIFELLTIRPLKNATPLSLVIITIGVSILLRGIVMLLWGKDTRVLPAFSGYFREGHTGNARRNGLHRRQRPLF